MPTEGRQVDPPQAGLLNPVNYVEVQFWYHKIATF